MLSKLLTCAPHRQCYNFSNLATVETRAEPHVPCFHLKSHVRKSQMRILKIAAILFSAVLAQSANASVIFSWKTDTLSDTITSAEGMIELTDAAAKSGAVSYSLLPECFASGCTDPLSPIVSFHFVVNRQSIDLHGTGAGLRFPQWSYFATNFLVEDNRLTNFSLYANDSETDIRFTTSVSFNTDRPGPCSYTGVCTGATGQFVQVPEPGTMALTGVGFLLAVYRRKKLGSASRGISDLST